MTITMDKPKVTPTGRLVLSAHAPRAEWLQARLSGIAATDVVAIMGLSKYRSAFDVWTEKVMAPDPNDDVSEAALWGTRLEEPVAREWADRHDVRLRRIGLIEHEAHPWAIASLDRVVNGCPDGRCGLEVKTRSLHVADQWATKVPDDVMAQVRWQLFVSGLDHIHVAALIGGQKLVEHIVERDAEHEERLFESAAIVMRAIETKEPPNLPAELWTSDFLEARHPERGGVIEVNVETAKVATEYLAVTDRIKYLTDDKEKLRTQLVGLLGDAEVATYEGQTLYTFTTSESKRMNTKMLAEKYPDVVADAAIWTTTKTRTLRVK